jgi:ParB family chromosome partitioning protein
MTDSQGEKVEVNENCKTIGLVKIAEILSNPDHGRKTFNQASLESLAQSIKMVGILQPILVRKDEEGKIHLIIGERRVRAAKMAGKTEIPAIFVNPKTAIISSALSLIENMQNEALTPIDEAESLHNFRYNLKVSDRALIPWTGKSKKEIDELIELNTLPNNVKAYCRRGDHAPQILTKRKLRQIAKVENLEVREDIQLYDLFYCKRSRDKEQIAKDKAKSLNRTLSDLAERGDQGCGKEEMKVELREVNRNVVEVLKKF